MKLMAVVVCADLLSLSAMGGSFYVSSNGDDSAEGTHGNPFKTVERARDAARSDAGHSTVFLREGRFVLSEPVIFGLQDGNTTYTAYQDEKPVITSAVAAWMACFKNSFMDRSSRAKTAP